MIADGPTQAGAAAQPVRDIVIDARSPAPGLDWAELWRYRELFLVLVKRDIAVRYQQTALGVLWAVLQPLAMVAIFSLVFGRLTQFKPAAAPYPLYAFAALLPWLFFAGSLNAAGNSVLASRGLVSKVYFPRLIIPLSAIGAPFVDFCVGSTLMLAWVLYAGLPPGPGVLLLPLFALLTALTAVGVGSFVAAMAVSYRDFRHLLPFLISTWMFLTPVIYPPTLFPERWRWALQLNPMTGVVEGTRAAWLGLPVDWSAVGTAGALALLLFVAGVRHFNRAARGFADVI